MENINNFTYINFKSGFNTILDKVYKVKSKKIFLTSKDINELEILLDEALTLKNLFYSYNKINYFNKLKINIHIFLLRLEVVSSELYD